MKTLKAVLLASALTFTSLASANDCAVGYAHMQQGNHELAYNEFRPLAERGYTSYMNIVADMHLKGQGVPASKMMAHVWYSLAAAQDNKTALLNRKTIAAQLSLEQLVDSKYLTREYAKSYLEPYVSVWALK